MTFPQSDYLYYLNNLQLKLEMHGTQTNNTDFNQFYLYVCSILDKRRIKQHKQCFFFSFAVPPSPQSAGANKGERKNTHAARTSSQTMLKNYCGHKM